MMERTGRPPSCEAPESPSSLFLKRPESRGVRYGRGGVDVEPSRNLIKVRMSRPGAAPVQSQRRDHVASLGRDGSCAFALEDVEASRMHGLFLVRYGRDREATVWTYVHLGTNPTEVDGVPLRRRWEERDIETKSRVVVGQTRIDVLLAVCERTTVAEPTAQVVPKDLPRLLLSKKGSQVRLRRLDSPEAPWTEVTAPVTDRVWSWLVALLQTEAPVDFKEVFPTDARYSTRTHVADHREALDSKLLELLTAMLGMTEDQAAGEFGLTQEGTELFLSWSHAPRIIVDGSRPR